MLYFISAPSFTADVMLRQISSNASANTITVSIPEIDESDGPIRLGKGVRKHILILTIILFIVTSIL